MTAKPVQPGDVKWWIGGPCSKPKQVTIKQVRATGWYESNGVGFFPNSFADLFDTYEEACAGMIQRATADVECAEREVKNARNRLKSLQKRLVPLPTPAEARKQ